MVGNIGDFFLLFFMNERVLSTLCTDYDKEAEINYCTTIEPRLFTYSRLSMSSITK